MSTLLDPVASARSVAGCIFIVLASGREIHFAAAENPRLRGASDDDLNRIEVSPLGVHWPSLDEDLSVRGLLAGDFGQHQAVSLDASR